MFKFNWFNKFGTIPSSYREAMSYEEQILWLCQQIENLKLESGNYNYNMLENKPSINGVTLEGNINASQLGLDNYNYLLYKPAINGVTLLGNKTLTDLGIQGTLIAGSGIRIIGNTISATGGGSGGSNDYRDLEHKPSINGFTLVGDSTARELKLQDLLEVDRSLEVYHTTNMGKIANIGSYQINETIPLNIPTTNYSNACYLVYNVGKGSYFDIYGNYDLFKIGNGNTLQLTYSTNNEVEHGYFEALSNGYIIINFYDIGNYSAVLKEYLSGEGINQDFDDTNKDLNSYKYDLDTFLMNNFNYDNLLTNAQEGLFIAMSEGNPLPAPIEDSTSRYVKIDRNLDYSSIFMVVGECNSSYMWFTTKNNNGTEYFLTHSKMNIIANGKIAVDIPEEADYIYFQFTNFNASSNFLQGLKITEISDSGASVNKITSPITLLANTLPSLTTGLYVLEAPIYIGSASPANLMFSVGEIIYYDSSNATFYGDYNMLALESGTWNIYQNEHIENTLSNSRNKIPTSQAVYNALQNAGTDFYTELQNDITFNLDGTISDSTGTITLTTGFYLTKLVNYVDDNGTNLAPLLSQNLCYYTASTNSLALTGLQRGGLLTYSTFLNYMDSTNGWFYFTKSFNNVLDTSKIATSISSSSTDSQVASPKAVFDLHNHLSYCVADIQGNSYTITQPWTAGAVQLNLNSLVQNYGGDFTFTTDNTIKVGSRPKIIELFGVLNPYDLSTGNHSFSLLIKRIRNGTTSLVVGQEIKATSNMLAFSVHTITDVEENDEFFLAVGTSSSSSMTFNCGGSTSALIIRTLSEVLPS